MLRALILDLDNTIYPVSDIADDLFASLFDLMDKAAEELSPDMIERVKDEFTRRPYQHVAEKFHFSNELTQAGLSLLQNLTYNKPMQPFADYAQIRAIPLDKFLVTTGFIKLQMSKVKMLGIESDFKELHIVDPATSLKTKQHVFAELMEKHQYKADELLVIGDDPESEIKAANGLGIPTFLFDPEGKHLQATSTYRSDKLADVLTVV